MSVAVKLNVLARFCERPPFGDGAEIASTEKWLRMISRPSSYEVSDEKERSVIGCETRCCRSSSGDEPVIEAEADESWQLPKPFRGAKEFPPRTYHWAQ